MTIPGPRRQATPGDEPSVDIWQYPEHAMIAVGSLYYPGNLRMCALGFHLIAQIRGLANQLKAATETAAAVFGPDISDRIQQRLDDPQDPLDLTQLAYDLSSAVLNYRP